MQYPSIYIDNNDYYHVLVLSHENKTTILLDSQDFHKFSGYRENVVASSKC